MSMRNCDYSQSNAISHAYDSFGRRILEADILNRWVRHTEYRGLSMDVWKNAAVHGIKEPRNSRGIDSTGMVFCGMQDFLPAFADFSLTGKNVDVSTLKKEALIILNSGFQSFAASEILQMDGGNIRI